ncbi:hypothetical protein BVRB_4g077610 [Beta vulgaris subsp. vulgaris]|uniref:7-deoxyloganetic acid glucosyltransferase n=1 Tax=Beta vulgaris subsp. vulgaris TaxID=3555 RepID=UPI00054012CA|nr:7-deoxyloganetic acid glucosyltransferase [Beta vulgaris subsp. vulgaris]XP_057250429.1 7-deoxyloganetic acid glucosyltransferase [Beta vulgaris subsp. vulgaris]XP_057250430.1 7-deoxyloganetic acid glucosyltransferase [Beta vulgaris subsp. vulgaris]KMT13920.1 hypothetical protein BVRB_4g077610 [Beta vulgaris subsp. vulgaris]
MEDKSFPSSHILIFPLPLQGHITPMLHLAELFCLANLKVTFLNTNKNHKLLTQHTDIQARFARYPSFRFETIPDSPSKDQPQAQAQAQAQAQEQEQKRAQKQAQAQAQEQEQKQAQEQAQAQALALAVKRSNLKDALEALHEALAPSAEPLLRELLFGTRDKITCFIIDGWLRFAYEIASEAEVPVIAFRCPSACCIWAYFCIPHIIEAGEVPFKDNEEMDQLVKNVPGMDSFLRCRDLPSFCREQDMSSCCELQEYFVGEIQRTKYAHSFILNTFEDLEGPILSQIRSQCSTVYSIGPLHAHLKYRLGKGETPLSNNSSSSLWEVDKSCISWLDQKPDKSVIYVSLGSTTTLTKDQLTELWTGLVQSKRYFLWVVSPNVIIEGGLDSPTPNDLLEGTEKRGCIVKWSPQDEVLTHRAIGGFLTHSGWNSTLESIVAGVPMLCWPHFADQQLNSRFASEVWRIGLDMKDTCDRTIVEKMINDLMDGKKDELQRSAKRVSQEAKKSISEGGSSYSNLNRLIEDIIAMSNK